MEISRATRARASETCWPGGLIGPLRSTSFDAWALDQDSALIEMQSEVIARFENRIARLEASVSTGSVLNLTPRATAPDFLWWHPRLQWLCRSAQAPVISSLETPPLKKRQFRTLLNQHQNQQLNQQLPFGKLSGTMENHLFFSWVNQL